MQMISPLMAVGTRRLFQRQTALYRPASLLGYSCAGFSTATFNCPSSGSFTAVDAISDSTFSGQKSMRINLKN